MDCLTRNHVTSHEHFTCDGENTPILSRLPDELIMEILSRVNPFRTLLTCTQVCSSFRHLIRTKQFTKMHLRNTNLSVLLQVVTPNYIFDEGWYFIDDDSDGNPQLIRAKSKVLNLFNYPNCFRSRRAHASCDGLLVFRVCQDTYVICNPMNREETQVQLKVGDFICGFYFHKLENEYKLLLHQRKDKNSYSIYDLSNNDRKSFSSNVNSFIDQPGVFTCGALFWIIGKHFKERIYLLMFNTNTEEFTRISLPIDVICNELSLLEVEGKLGLCDSYAKSVKIWILEDVESGKWVNRYVIDTAIGSTATA